MTKMQLTQVPVLPIAVRNIVIARATAGAYDATEATYKTIQECRRAAREKLGMLHLNHAQAEAVDALVIAARAMAHEAGSFSVDGKTMVMEPRVLAAVQPTLVEDAARVEERDTMKAILAVLTRMEQLFAFVVAVVFRRAPDQKLLESSATMAPSLPPALPAQFPQLSIAPVPPAIRVRPARRAELM
jgi:hypothetical protein